jgi:lysozyme
MGLALKLARALSAPLPQASNEALFVSRMPNGPRRVSDAGVNLIKAFEGVHLEAYHDPVGFPTQGVGRLLSRDRWADLAQWPLITHDIATVWLNQDLDKFSGGVERLLPVPLNDNEHAALTSFAFNLGLGALEASTLRRMLLRGEFREEVAGQFLRWNKAGGRVMSGLTRRRRAEAELFLSTV